MQTASIVAALIGLTLGAALAWLFGVKRYAAALREETRNKEALLDSAAQQMRAPLNDVLGLVQTLAFRSKEFSAENAELIDTIVGAGANVKAVLLDVFDILDLESGRMRIKRGVDYLPEIADFIERTNRRRAEKAGVALDIDVAASAQAWFQFDALRVRQCVGSMTRQCVLQGPGGAVSVFIEVVDQKKRKKGRRIVVTVKDNSAGMVQEEAERYFSPKDFSQNSFLMNSGASPLSLIVARLLAREMRGKLAVKSAPGAGVAFRLEVPANFVRKAHKEDPAARLTPFDVASLLMRDKVVLAVDDNSVNLRVLEAFLSRLSPKKILTAANGAEALKVLRDETCDIVLMDVRMPVMDGLAATKEIRASRAAWRSVPIIAVSAAAADDAREACAGAGMDAFLAKPVSAEELYERIARVLSH